MVMRDLDVRARLTTAFTGAARRRGRRVVCHIAARLTTAAGAKQHELAIRANAAPGRQSVEKHQGNHSEEQSRPEALTNRAEL